MTNNDKVMILIFIGMCVCGIAEQIIDKSIIFPYMIIIYLVYIQKDIRDFIKWKKSEKNNND